MMAAIDLSRLKLAAGRTFKNPHFWVLLALLAILLFTYQAWPWPERQFTHGFWRFFPWLSTLRYLVVNVELKINILGVLFFIPIIYGSVTLSWPGGLFAWLVSLVWLLPTLLLWPGMSDIANLVLLLLPPLLVAVMTAERRWRAGERRNFAEREEERRAYVLRLVDTQEAERRRIAQEIHDETLQTLLGIANHLDSLAATSIDDEQVAEHLAIKQKVLQSTEDLRRLSMNLRPSILDNFGLISGVRWLATNNSRNGCRIRTLVEGETRKMSSLAEITVFRVVQEAIANIQHHASAQNASVTLEFKDSQLSLLVEDDGVGFKPPERLGLYAEKGRLGVIGMQQRILSAGGTMQLESFPGQGTKIVATIPYSASDDIVQSEKA